MSCVLSMIYDVSSFFTWSFRLLIYSTSIPAPCKPGRRRVWFMTNNKLFLVASWIIDDKWDAAVVYITTNQTYSPTGYLNQVLLCAGGSLLYFSCSYVHFFFWRETFQFNSSIYDANRTEHVADVNVWPSQMRRAKECSIPPSVKPCPALNR